MKCCHAKWYTDTIAIILIIWSSDCCIGSIHSRQFNEGRRGDGKNVVQSKEKKRKEKKRKGKQSKAKQSKGKERKGKERKGKERKKEKKRKEKKTKEKKRKKKRTPTKNGEPLETSPKKY